MFVELTMKTSNEEPRPGIDGDTRICSVSTELSKMIQNVGTFQGTVFLV